MKLWATITYVNNFEVEVPDDATEEEILNKIFYEDEYLGGDWDADWEIMKGEE